jgi:hypothetical protein
MVGEEMYRWLRDVDGFEGLLVLDDRDVGKTYVLALWENRDVAERNRVARANLRDRVAATVGVEILDTEGFEVAFGVVPRLGPEG